MMLKQVVEKKMKKVYLFSLFSILLLLAACSSSKPAATKAGFIGGKEGLSPSLNVLSGKANEVLDANLEDFQIAVNLQNKGEYAVQQDEVLGTVTGVDYNSFSLTTPSLRNVEPLEKVRSDQSKSVAGGQTVLSFPAKFRDDLPVDQVYDLGVNVCYKYQTGATSSLCLRREATKRGESSDKCSVNNNPVIGSSGAPIQVTSISQRPTGANEISFTIAIENVGKGDVYPPTFIQTNQQCLEKNDVKNKFQIALSFPENKPAISCPALANANQGMLQLIQGKATLTCKIDTSQEQDTTFSRSPNIQLDYVYKDLVSTKITVRNAA